jgi:hypothetical protein
MRPEAEGRRGGTLHIPEALMSLVALDRIQALGSDPRPQIPAATVVDALLDLRNEIDSPMVVAVIDRHLTVLGHRGVLADVEVRSLLDELATATAGLVH